jgi:hypothetical protein
VALGLEWVGMSHIRKTTIPQVIRAILKIVQSTTGFGFVSMLSTVITGIYMVLAAVGWAPWLLVVIGALLLVIVLTRVLTAPRMAAIGQALDMDKGSVSTTFSNLLKDAILWISIQTRMAIVLGIIFLKIARPGLGGALLTIGVAIALGIASALSRFRAVRAREASAG